MVLVSAAMKSSVYILLTSLCFSFAKVTSDISTDDFAININTDGSYSVQVKGNVWLKSAPTFFRANGQFCTTANETLKLQKTTATTGSDIIGTWKATNFIYEGATRPFQASIYVYTPDPAIFTYNNPSVPFILFKQTYLGQVNATQAFTNDETIAGFPGFVAQAGAVPLGYLSYGGGQFGYGDKTSGVFEKKINITSGLGSGPIAIFDREKTANTLILSPASAFMATNLWVQSTSMGQNLYWGLMGGISDVWSGFETSTILFYSNLGINKGFVSWGQIMQKWYGRDNKFAKSDFTINYLGFWTDNGGYYHYRTDPHKNYQDTIVDGVNHIKELGIPFRYIQFDSWWYFKGPEGGVMTWESRPDVFPNGMEWLFNKTGLPVAGHNRYWSNETTYAKDNGGKYSFIIEGSKAVPTDQCFWDDLLSNGRKWGLIMYEQDWLTKEFEGIPSMMSNPELAEQWLNQMGQGAANNGLTIQYCMSSCRHILQGISIPTVTQARVSTDYHPGREQWRIGVTSLLAWAIGIIPFKDNFWTSPVQPGDPYKNATEPWSELNAVVATLSTGPVGPSDMFVNLNKSLIMKSVNSEGLILKPSRPATAIDNMIRRLAWSDFEGPSGEVWSTYSDFGGSNKYGIVLGADLQGNYTMTPCMAGYQGFPKSMIFSSKDPSKIQLLTDAQPLQMSGCTKVDFCLYYVSPVIESGGSTVLIQGELDKWVPMSPQRVEDINIENDDINIRLRGGFGEVISFWFNVDGQSKSVQCSFGESGIAVISYVQWRCLEE